VYSFFLEGHMHIVDKHVAYFPRRINTLQFLKKMFTQKDKIRLGFVQVFGYRHFDSIYIESIERLPIC